MSASRRAPKPGPMRPRQPVARLDSLKNPQPRPPPQSQKSPSITCPNPECGTSDGGHLEDGKTICRACGTVIEDSNIVSEVSYGLSSGGQHVVHGYHVAADATIAKRGDVVDPSRNMTSRQVTESAGHRYIIMIGVALQMPAHLREAGMLIFKLAIGGFIQGRRIKSVAAVALYIACRTQTEPNTYMLIDFADILQIDVFNLGSVYKMLLEHIRLNGTGWVVQPINPEDLILRFCQRLEFGGETMKVAKDAVRIVQRMNRDWMTPGRRPAGICGAALILAARMNNFRRTVREVVYIVKVQEQTIFNRLDEFKITESSGLTVDEFRTIDLERTADPPIFTAQKGGKGVKKKRGRKRKEPEFDDDGDNNLPTVISSRASSATPSVTGGQSRTPSKTHRQKQIDSQKMPPPPLPIDPNLLGNTPQQTQESVSSPSRAASDPITEKQDTETLPTIDPPSGSTGTNRAISEPPTKRKRGRKPKPAVKEPISRLADDQTLDADIAVALTDPLDLDHANALTTALESVPTPPATQQDTSDKSARKRPPIPDAEEIHESEFCDDIEVLNCLLSAPEVAIKTRIWTHENREYLRARSAKLMKQQLAEENGTARKIIPRKRKRMRMGDMTQYVGEDADDARPVAGSPAEAVMKMMGRRAFSTKLNYDMINAVYQPSSSGSSTRRGSTSILSQSPGSGFEMSGALSPKGVTKPPQSPSEEVVEEEESEVGDQDTAVQQRMLDTIADRLEEEGINESDDDDNDPYDDGGGYDSG